MASATAHCWGQHLGEPAWAGAAPYKEEVNYDDIPKAILNPCFDVARDGTLPSMVPLIDSARRVYVPMAGGVVVVTQNFERDYVVEVDVEEVGTLTGSLALLEDRLYFTTSKGYACCMSGPKHSERRFLKEYCKGTGADPWAMALSREHLVAAGRPQPATERDQWNSCVYVLDAATGATRWMHTSTMLLFFKPALLDDVVIFTEFTGKVRCFKLKSGDEQWTAKPDKPSLSTGGATASKKLGLVFVAGNQPGKKLWNAPYGGKGLARCQDLKTGAQKWAQPLDLEANTKPCVLLGGKEAIVIYTLGANPSSLTDEEKGRLRQEPWRLKAVGLAAADGRVLWSLDLMPYTYWMWYPTTIGKKETVVLAAAISDPVCSASGSVYVACGEGGLYTIDGYTGVTKCLAVPPTASISSPALGPGMLLLRDVLGEVNVWQEGPWVGDIPQQLTVKGGRWPDVIHAHSDRGEVLQELERPWSESGTEHFWPTKAGDVTYQGAARWGRFSKDISRPAWSFCHKRNHGGDSMENTCCIDAQGNVYAMARMSTGILIFRPDGSLRGRIHAGRGPQTPMLHGETIYCTSQYGYAFAYDLTSLRLRWKRRYCYTVAPDSWAATVVDGVLLLAGRTWESLAGTDWDKNMHNLEIFGLDIATGGTKWLWKTPREPIYNMMPAVLDGRVYIADANAGRYCLELQTGELVWATPPPEREYRFGTFTCLHMVVGRHGTAYAGWNEEAPREWNKFSLGGPAVIRAIRLEDGGELWTRKWPDWEVHTAPLEVPAGERWLVLVHLGSIPQDPESGFGGDTWPGRLEGLDGQTGELVWRFDPEEAYRSQLVAGSSPENFTLPDHWSSFTLGGDGTVYTCELSGLVFALEGATGKLLSKYYAADMGPGSIALAPGLLAYLATHRCICWRDPEAEQEWRKAALQEGDPRAEVPWPLPAPARAEEERQTRDRLAEEFAPFVVEGSRELCEEGHRSRHASPPLPGPVPADQKPGRLWWVIGGEEAGSILAREGRALKSKALEERLQRHAIIEELQKEGDRLRFKKRFGKGPDTGWVSFAARGTPLLAEVILKDD